MLTGLYEENHAHTNYSDGEPSIQQYLEYNKKHKKFWQITFSDHVHKTSSWVKQYVEEIKKERINHPEVNIKIGCEVKILNDGTLNTTDEILDQCEEVIGSVHFFEDVENFEGMTQLSTEKIMDRERNLLIALVKNSRVTIVGHPFGMTVLFRKFNVPYKYYEEVYDWCKAYGKKFEYNSSYSCPNLELFIKDIIEKDGTIYLSIGSDVHSLRNFGEANKKLVPEINVLVTEAGSSVAQGVLKVLIRDKDMMGYVIHVADSNSDATGLWFNGIDYKFVIPPIENKKLYLQKLREYIIKNNIDIILIGGEIELEILSNKENQKRLLHETNCKILVGDDHFISLTTNKEETANWCVQNNIPHPKILANSNEAEDNKLYVIKPKIGWGMEELYKTNNPNHIKGTDFEKNLVQEFINGKEITCEVVKTDGHVNGIICMDRVIHKGVTKTAKTILPDFKNNRTYKIYSFVLNVAKKLRWNGLFNIQLLEGGDNLYLMEINGRLSGTTGLRNLCGFDSIRMMILYECFGIPINSYYLDTFKGLKFYRYWDEVVYGEQNEYFGNGT